MPPANVTTRNPLLEKLAQRLREKQLAKQAGTAAPAAPAAPVAGRVSIAQALRTPPARATPSTLPVTREPETLPYTLPEGFAVRARTLVPRSYQVDGITFLRQRKRAILGDAPGLGKTFQAAEAAKLPCVITCPLPLVDMWKDFLEQEYPDTKVYVAAYGSVLKRDPILQAFEAATKAGEQCWLVVNHDMFRQYFIPTATTLIVDEMHHMRHKDAARSKSLALYAKRAGVERVFGLTATPVYKDISDLWHLLHILDPQTWSSYHSFLGTYANVSNYGYGTKVLGMRNKAMLDRNTRDLMLQRTYASVNMQLPERIDKHVIMRMTDKLRKSYNTLRDFYRLQLEDGEYKHLFNAGQVLHELRKLTVSPEKLAEVREIVEDTRAGGDDAPIVVFVWYRDTAERVAEALNKGDDGFGAVVIDGEMPAIKRATIARQSKLIVATMSSMSEGVDLSEARTLIYVEETYVPGQSYQSMSRVMRHRTGEGADDRPIICYWIRYAATIDQLVHDKAKARVNHSAMDVLKEALGMADDPKEPNA